MRGESGRSAVFGLLLAATAAALLALPLVATSQDLLASCAAALHIEPLLALLAPAETMLAAGLLQMFGVPAGASGNRLVLAEGGLPQTLVLSWNCVGWQMFVLLALSLLVGLRPEHSPSARAQVALLGLMGTLLVNVVRIAVVALLTARSGYAAAMLFHDYGSVALGVAWLFVFWEGAYRLMLEPIREA